MQSFALLRSIRQGTWLMDKSQAETYLPLVTTLLKGGAAPTAPDELIPSYVVTPRSGAILEVEGWAMPDEIESGSILVIPLCGPVIKYDSWCEVGTQTKAQQLAEAYEDPRIEGIIFKIDTPGGEALATEILEQAINARTKPVVGVIDGMMCSAGVWIGSAMERLFVAGNTCLIGSIGTMVTYADFSNYYKNEGIELRDIYAPASVDKNREWRDAKQGNDATMQDRLLTPLNDMFIATVVANRPGLDKAKTLTGRTFFGEEAIAAGLADEFGDLNTAIEYIMFKSKFSALEKYSAKQKLTPAEVTAVQEILTKGGLPVTLAMPSAQLFAGAGEDRDIYVYAEEGEDAVGKQCVYADEQGNPSQDNVSDGEHALEGGKTMTTSTHDDGLSYVDAVADAVAETPQEKPAEQKTKVATAVSFKEELTAALGDFKKDILSAVDKKFTDLRTEIGTTTKVPAAGKSNFVSRKQLEQDNKKTYSDRTETPTQRRVREFEEQRKNNK